MINLPSLLAVYPKQRLIGLCDAAKGTRVHVEGPSRIGLVLGDVDGSQPSAIHTGKRGEIVSLINHGNIHRDLNLLGLLTSRVDDRPRRVECHSLRPFPHIGLLFHLDWLPDTYR